MREAQTRASVVGIDCHSPTTTDASASSESFRRRARVRKTLFKIQGDNDRTVNYQCIIYKISYTLVTYTCYPIKTKRKLGYSNSVPATTQQKQGERSKERSSMVLPWWSYLGVGSVGSMGRVGSVVDADRAGI